MEACGALGSLAGAEFLARTTDGGATWRSVGPAAGSFNAGFYGTSAAMVVAWGSSTTTTYSTQDGGSRWATGGSSGYEEGDTVVDLLSPSSAFFLAGAAGNARPLTGDLYRTTDTGAHWAKVSSPQAGGKPFGGCIAFRDGRLGWTTSALAPARRAAAVAGGRHR